MEVRFIKEALISSFKKLNPRVQKNNFILFVVYLCAIITTFLFFLSFWIPFPETRWFTGMITLFLWITVFFANFAESIAEGRGKASAEYLRKTKKDSIARVLENADKEEKYIEKSSYLLKKGDIVLVKAKEQIPLDGEVIKGVASVDESAITGESAPVIREAGGDRNSVTGGTTVLSDQLIIRISVSQGESFLDKMIEMIEGAKRQKTPNEIALEILLFSLTSIFFLVILALYLWERFTIQTSRLSLPISIVSLIALFVCLIPTTIGSLLSSIGVAGMSRLNSKKVLASSGKAIEAAGDVDVLLLDKTGTITLGNRRASEFYPVQGVKKEELAYYASLSSVADETPEGRSIVVLAKNEFNIRPQNLHELKAEFVPFSATTKMSGMNLGEMKIRKGAPSRMEEYAKQNAIPFPSECKQRIEEIAKQGGTPLVVASNQKVYGVIFLKDIIKGGIKERFSDLRKMGIKTVMITGDNEVTAHAIAREAGVDDFLAEATPEMKLKLIRKFQQEGHLVAMTGDGTNDAPALAAADVAVAMNSGTTAAKEAGNMIDLDSDPTKLIDIVKVGKGLLMTRGALTTFSIANDIAKYFAIIPSLFSQIYPNLALLNIMRLATPETGILSAVIFNTFIILFLIPIALKGVNYKEMDAEKLLKRNLGWYGLGGVVAPFLGIKLIDLFLSLFLR